MSFVGYLRAALPASWILGLFVLAGPIQEPKPIFHEVGEELGVSFVHHSGATGEKFMVETMGAGVAFFDYDLDGDSDLYLVQGGAVPGAGAEDAHGYSGELYRNDPGRFTVVTERAGLDRSGYGMGAAVGDIDNDGDPDLLVTQVGPNQLYINNGDGTFFENSARAGVDDPAWGASAAFSDLDSDGDLDLYVTNYLDWSVGSQPDCSQLKSGARLRAYCLPDAFRGVPDSLYENLGDGVFRPVGPSAGVAMVSGKGLGVIPMDYDEDGLVDLYVANDTVPNFLFRNLGRQEGLRFEDAGLTSGTAYDHEGNALAGMGLATGDFDRDGDSDLFVTNFQGESNTLYRNDGGGFFSDVSFVAGVGRGSLKRLGFGTQFADFDNDGFLDLVVANGHVLDNAEILYEGTDYAQPNQLFFGSRTGAFNEIEHPFSGVAVSRGLATADWDSDGDLDLVFTNSNGRVELHRNDTRRASNSGRVRLVGRSVNRDALGASLHLRRAEGLRERRELHSGGSYLSESERIIHIGMESQTPLDVVVTWPAGEVSDNLVLRPGDTIVVVEALGVVRRWTRK